MLKTDKMIIVPHSDDEILLYGGLIHRSLVNKEKIKIVICTNGDYLCTNHEYGERRIKETIEGVAVLGLEAEDVIILGFPDTGVEAHESTIYSMYQEIDENKIFSSACSNMTYGIQNIKEDYFYIKKGTHAYYTKKNFTDLIAMLLEDFRPSEVYTTSQWETHYDHVGLYYFVRDGVKNYNLTCMNQYQPIKLYEGIVHSLAGDDNWPARNQNNFELDHFCKPFEFEISTELKWEDRISLCLLQETIEHASGNLKHQALMKYKSQLKPDVKDYLEAFIKKDEIFWKVKQIL